MLGRLRRPDIRQERVDLFPQNVGLAAQRAGGGQHFAGRGSSLRRGAGDADDVGGDLAGAAGGVLDVARDGRMFRRRSGEASVSLFRDGPKDQTRNLEILRCAIAHHSSMLRIAPE